LKYLDHDCVSLPTPLLEFRQRFRTDYKSSSPILVHCRLNFILKKIVLFFIKRICSAGVGRSGTFIALDALLEMVKSQDILDILEFTHRMR
jgi:netrin-G3 ligand